MLTNAVIAGVAVALYIAVLVLQLNPHYSIAGFPALVVTLVVAYGLNIAAVFYALIVFHQVVAAEPISPGWISFRVLVWLCTLGALAGAALTWTNLLGFEPVLDPTTAMRMTGGAVALSLCAVFMLLLAAWHRWKGRQGSKYEAALLALLLTASVAVPMTFRGPGTVAATPSRDPAAIGPTAEDTGEGRVILLLFEGASLDVIAPAAADGRLPHFGRLVESAAFMHVATIRPTQPGTVWTAAATGKLPVKNGIRSAGTYWPVGGGDAIDMLPDSCFAHALVQFRFLRQQLHTSLDLTARPLWNILSQQGVPVGVVNWSVTQPARQVQGYQVSDAFERLAGSSVDLENTESVWPRDAVGIAAAAVLKPGADPRGVPSTAGSDGSELIATTCRSDRVHEQIATDLERQFPSRFRAIRYRCLDAAGHYLLRYAVPNPFGDVSEEDVQRYNVALGGFYAAADAAVGRALAAMRPRDLLVVMSGFGMDPMDMGKRLLERTFGNPVPTGTHERAPDGFMFAFGSAVTPGRYSRASIVDLTPTLLYYFGLPVGRDMDGFARTDIFSRDFTAHRPITFIPSYER